MSIEWSRHGVTLLQVDTERPHTGQLWDASGAVLATAAFANESASGWQTATLSNPVVVVKGASYTTSYTAPAGRYASEQNRFSSGRTITNQALTATKGVYRYGGGYPTDSWNGSNYYVDVLFSPATRLPSSSAKTSSVPSTTGPVGSSSSAGTTVSLIPATSSNVSSTTTSVPPPPRPSARQHRGAGRYPPTFLRRSRYHDRQSSCRWPRHIGPRHRRCRRCHHQELSNSRQRFQRHRRSLGERDRDGQRDLRFRERYRFRPLVRLPGEHPRHLRGRGETGVRHPPAGLVDPRSDARPGCALRRRADPGAGVRSWIHESCRRVSDPSFTPSP